MELTPSKFGTVLMFLGSVIVAIPALISIGHLKEIVERMRPSTKLSDIVHYMPSQVNPQQGYGLSEADVYSPFDFSNATPSLESGRYGWALPFTVLLITLFLVSVIALLLLIAQLGVGPDLVVVVERFKAFWLYVLTFLILLVAVELVFFVVVIISALKGICLSFIVYMVNGNYNRRFAVFGLLIGTVGVILNMLD